MAVNAKNWQELKKPNALEKKQSGGDNRRRAAFVAEPLERGFGMTLGNSLRRVLLSWLQGAAVTSIKIDGVLHEFSSLTGVREDVTDIVLNVKQIALKMEGEGPKRLHLSATGPADVTLTLPGTPRLCAGPVRPVNGALLSKMFTWAIRSQACRHDTCAQKRPPAFWDSPAARSRSTAPTARGQATESSAAASSMRSMISRPGSIAAPKHRPAILIQASCCRPGATRPFHTRARSVAEPCSTPDPSLRNQGTTSRRRSVVVAKRIENRIRFGHQVSEQIIDRHRRVLGFASGSIFAFVRWTSDDFGIALSRVDILRAVASGQAIRPSRGSIPAARACCDCPVGRRSNASCNWSRRSSMFSLAFFHFRCPLVTAVGRRILDM